MLKAVLPSDELKYIAVDILPKLILVNFRGVFLIKEEFLKSKSFGINIKSFKSENFAIVLSVVNLLSSTVLI